MYTAAGAKHVATYGGCGGVYVYLLVAYSLKLLRIRQLSIETFSEYVIQGKCHEKNDVVRTSSDGRMTYPGQVSIDTVGIQGKLRWEHEVFRASYDGRRTYSRQNVYDLFAPIHGPIWRTNIFPDCSLQPQHRGYIIAAIEAHTVRRFCAVVPLLGPIFLW